MLAASAHGHVDEPRLMIGGIAILGTVTAAIATWFLGQIGAQEDAAAASAGGPTTAKLLAEIRALHERLDRIERGVEAPPSRST